MKKGKNEARYSIAQILSPCLCLAVRVRKRRFAFHTEAQSRGSISHVSCYDVAFLLPEEKCRIIPLSTNLHSPIFRAHCQDGNLPAQDLQRTLRFGLEV